MEPALPVKQIHPEARSKIMVCLPPGRSYNRRKGKGGRGIPV